MTQTLPPEHPRPFPSVAYQDRNALFALVSLWLLLFVAALFSPPVLDDADATHASAARHIVLTGDWVTLHVNGIRYLEKAPLPYWLVALCFRLFGFNTFATHLPQAIAVLLLALLGYRWAGEAFGPRAALYTGLATLTSVGVFLFTRIFIPEVILSLFLCTALYCLLHVFSPLHQDKSVILSDGGALAARAEGPAVAFRSPSGIGKPTSHAYIMWTALALAVLTKGLVALVFFLGAAILYLILTGDYTNWRALKPFTGVVLFLAIAAPWHILAGLRNTGGENGRGFLWFYFVNEHFLRFLGRRIPMDYNKLPSYLYWSLHLVWLFPWALFAGILVRDALANLRRYNERNPLQSDQISYWQPFAVAVVGILLRDAAHIPYLFTVFIALILFAVQSLRRRQVASSSGMPLIHAQTSAQQTTLLLSLFSAIVLIFFALSTNQEYYTFPAYLPLLILIAAALARAEQPYDQDPSSDRWITFAHATFTLIGVAIAITLACGLWTSRHLPFVPDIGDLLAHRGVGNYTLSMSHLFDLTGPSFAALRFPATLAALAFALGPAIAWLLRRQQRHLAATSAIAITAAVFFIAAHLALIRFAPMLSSKNFAEKIQQLQTTRAIAPTRQVILFGDQSYGSSIAFYLDEQVSLVDGRSSSMLFGSTFPDAPPIFLTHDQLLAAWGIGPRKILFVPLEHRDDVDHLLGDRKILLAETSGKALFTDRPLDTPAR